MADLRVRKQSGAEAVIREADVEEFRGSLRGLLLRAGDDGYDEARKVWNGMIDRRPAMIARCLGAADVVRAVQFAGAQQLLVAVRGGGHSLSGQSVCDDGLMIDLSLMRGVAMRCERWVVKSE